MKRINKIIILVIFVMILFTSTLKLFAYSEGKIIVSKENIKSQEEFEVKIELGNINVASLTMEIYFDKERLEFVKGPENSNFSNNRILYTWVSSSGIDEKDIEIKGFIFKGMKDGIAKILVQGEGFSQKGERIEIKSEIKQIQIGEIIKREEEIVQIENDDNNISKNNTNLSILRINHEGISPTFNKDIKEYYFIANETINDLEVTAVPENKNANVTVTGNTNLKIGKNLINIKVEAEDKSNSSEYNIYITKTRNMQKANANLETLAIRQASLNPEFNNNITKYKIEVSNDINKVDLLAIPQIQSATVKIIGNKDFKIGSNKIEVIVTAEDKLTNKKYEIEVYRRDNEEEIKIQQERKVEAEKLSEKLENNENKQNIPNEQSENLNQNKDINEDIISKENNNLIIIFSFIILIAIILLAVIIRKVQYKNSNK